jgi:hypothetical protein
MNIYLIAFGVLAIITLLLVFKVRSMPQYKISKEDDHDGNGKWFIKTRRGLSYYYLEQVHDAPGFVNDIFETSKMPVGGQETESLAEKVIINHRMTTVNGIEVEGE